MSGLKTSVVFVCGAIITVLLPLLLRAQFSPSLIFPNDSLVTPATSLVFQWNAVLGATGYHIQVDDDASFTPSLVDDQSILSTVTTFNSTLTSGKRYYWRVRANTAGGFTDWSPVWTFTVFSPTDINVTTWYKADFGVHYQIISGDSLVQQWDDASGNNNHAVQTDVNKRPRYVASAPVINNMPLINFSGYNEYVDFTTPLTVIRTVFWVIREDPAAGTIPRPLLGSPQGGPEPDFHRGYPTPYIYDDQYPSANNYARDGTTRVNGEVKNPKFTDVPETMSIISTKTLNGCKASNFSTDRFIYEPSIDEYRVWYGDLAELVIFNDPLSDSLIALVTQYLMDKYAPPANLGSDIITDYELCLTDTISPGHFNTYHWSTSAFETGDSISVSQPGTYSVTVVDQFGRTSIDSVIVRFVSPNVIQPDTICLGDSKLWDTGLSNAYTFQWNSGSTSCCITIQSEGDYSVTVTDTNSCTFISDTIHIEIDSLSALASLSSDDTTLCRGQSIGLASGADLADNYLWSTGETTSTIAIDTAGDYLLTVTNSFGCSATDSIHADVTATAPTANFSSTTVCFGNATVFTDNSVPPSGDAITDWAWDFGDGNTSSQRNPAYTFLSHGNHTVKLTVTAGNQCTNIKVKTVQVHALPQAYFSDTVVCAGIDRVFEDESSLAEQGIALLTWHWDFDDGTVSNQQNPVKQYDTTGVYTVTLKVTDSRTCQNTFTSQVESIVPVPDAATPNLLLPQNNITLSGSTVFFDWQAIPGAVYYTLEISLNSGFNNIVYTSEETAADSLTVTGLPGGAYYYWRVNAYNLCGNATVSDILLFNLFEPTNIPGLCLWLSADGNKDLRNTVNGPVVEKWYDRSSSGNNAVQTIDNFQPSFIPSVHALNGASVLRFDGTDDHVIFSMIDQIKTVFWVLKEDSNATIKYRHVLGCTDCIPDFHRGCCNPHFPGTTKHLWGPGHTPSSIINGITRLNTNPIRGDTTDAPTQYSILTVKPLGPAKADAFVIDRYDVVNEFRVWDGDLAELIIYCQPLTNDLIETVESYLNDKYAPPVNLGPDIVMEYGFCTPIEICAGDQYNSYSWSTGETTPCITVTSPGNYFVEVRNIFGIVSFDEVIVTGGLNTITLDDTLPLCMGDTLVWDTKLAYNSPDGLDYFFEWQDNSHDSFYVITQPGQYWVKVTDNALCSVNSDTLNVWIDSFEVQASLGADTLNLCSRNRLRLTVGADVAKSYWWSDGTTDSTLLVFASGEYSVTVENINGCEAVDTVYVNIFGVAPDANFSFDRNCFSDSTVFTDLSQPSADIMTWRWNFDDGTYADIQNPKHRFPDAEDYNVKLIVTDVAGCYQDAIKKVIVYPLPEAKFLNELVNCANDFVNFDDTSEVVFPQTITGWAWDFGDSLLSQQPNPIHLYQREGIYPVSLTVITDSQCSAIVYDTLEIFPELVADIRAENLCITGGIPQLFDNSPTFSNVAWNWDFGDGVTSTQQNPEHIFIEPGSYEVTLRVKNAVGCEREVTETIIITEPPVVDFDHPDLCENSSYQFSDNTEINGNDAVVEWQWNFGDQTFASIKNPVHSFSASGTYLVRLDVETQNGCESFGLKTVKVIEPPQAAFDFTPPYGGAPLTVTFSNLTTNATDYVWNFGDNSPESDETNPSHTYLQNGDIIVTLTASNLPGCNAIATELLQVATARFDIALDDIVLREITNNGDCSYLLDMSGIIIDKSTVNVTSFDIQAQSSAGGTLVGDWEGSFTNRQTTYHFSNQFLITDCEKDVVICMEVSNPNGNPDENPSDNRTCVTLSDELVIVGPYPNPTGDFINLDVILPSEDVFKISNFNVLGQELDVIGGNMTPAGYHRFTFDTKHLPQGVYILVIEYQDDEQILKYAVRK